MRILPEVKLVRLPRPKKAFKWAGNDDSGKPVGHRSKLGGKPDWLQKGYEAPVCPSCHSTMTFYGQLDSINDEATIADCGMIYVFLCFSCYEATAIALC